MDGFVPGHFDEGGILSKLADHRLAQAAGQNLRVVEIIPPVEAFQAQAAFVVDAVGRALGFDDAVMFRIDGAVDDAACAAVRADRSNRFIG